MVAKCRDYLQLKVPVLRCCQLHMAVTTHFKVLCFWVTWYINYIKTILISILYYLLQIFFQFVDCSIKICEQLNGMGHWAEFIDPMSGSPYYGPHTNATFFETDERYRHLGFRIEDLGCCRVISHRTWGTRMYVGKGRY